MADELLKRILKVHGITKQMGLLKPWGVLEKHLIALIRAVERRTLEQRDGYEQDRLAPIRAEAERGLNG